MHSEVASVIGDVLAKSDSREEAIRLITDMFVMLAHRSVERACDTVRQISLDTQAAFEDSRLTMQMLSGHAELVGKCEHHLGRRDAYLEAIRLIDADTPVLREELVSLAKKDQDEAEAYLALMKINRQ